MPGLNVGQLPTDSNGRTAGSGYAPAFGTMPIQLGSVSADGANGASGQQSAPVVIQRVGIGGTNTAAVDTGGVQRVALWAGPTASVNSAAVAVNTSNSATLAAVAAKTNYITGFSITTQGGTGAAAAAATITGLNGGTVTYEVGCVANGNVLFNHTFPTPLPASAVNTAIVLTVPALGANTGAAACAIYGFVA
jgi:hypothetical protein